MTQISPPPPRRRRAGLGDDRPLPAGYVRAPANGNGLPPDVLERRRRAGMHRRRTVPRRRRLLRVLLFVLAVFAACGAGLIAIAFTGYNVYKAQLPDATTIGAMEPPQDSYVYDGTGKLIDVFHGDTRHDHAPLAAISKWVKLATVDIEDRHFYEEGSWDLPRLVAAGLGQITHSSSSGGSTITEQLAKLSLEGGNLLAASSPRGLDYKIKEIVLGNEISIAFTKDQVLEMYLNRVFYGNQATGIQTAAQLYFHVDASKLDLAQSAMLAGLPQSPSYYNPVTNPGVARDRQLDVLNAMVNNGDISQAQADKAFAEPLTYYPASASDPAHSASDDNHAFLDYLASWMQQTYGDSFIDPGGWRIYTTLDPAKQALAQKTVHDQIVANGDQFNMHDASMVTMDPKSGSVVAMVGAYDYGDPHIGQINMATSGVSPGSSIKLFTYTAAIASGKYTMTTPVLDAPFTFNVPGGKSYSPQDYDRKWHGTCQLKQCLGNSFNMPAVKVEAGTGIPYIDNVEVAAGVNSIKSTCQNGSGQTVSNLPGPYDYAATLGGLTCGISVLDLADGASTIADLGMHHPATPVSKITDPATGQTIYTNDPSKTGIRVVPDNVAYIMDEITSNDANRAQEFGANGLLTLPGRRVSAKTGTGEYFIDNLTVGWTPDLLTAVWVGNPTPSCPGNSYVLADGGPCGSLNGIASGITGAAPIWHDFMAAALQNAPADWYTRPADVVATGPTDNADFFLPTGQKAGASNASSPGSCIYWQPQPDPNNPCTYVGTSAPSYLQSPPAPSKQPQPQPQNNNH
ncbi:MAG TPA: transglycosylase domain-containing protein [Candidatus Dormibacteraeota bacterium]